jgi:hypothetical protein
VFNTKNFTLNKQIFLKLYSFFRDIKETKSVNYIFTVEGETDSHIRVGIDFNTLVSVYL